MSKLDAALTHGLLEEVFDLRAEAFAVRGITPEHDDEMQGGELLQAALAYLTVAARATQREDEGRPASTGEYQSVKRPSYWPGDGREWRPTSIDDDLMAVMALVLREQERRRRAYRKHGRIAA